MPGRADVQLLPSQMQGGVRGNRRPTPGVDVLTNQPSKKYCPALGIQHPKPGQKQQSKPASAAPSCPKTSEGQATSVAPRKSPGQPRSALATSAAKVEKRKSPGKPHKATPRKAGTAVSAVMNEASAAAVPCADQIFGRPSLWSAPLPAQAAKGKSSASSTATRLPDVGPTSSWSVSRLLARAREALCI